MSQTIENSTIKDAGAREDCNNLENTACQAVHRPEIDAAYLRSLLESSSERLFGGQIPFRNCPHFMSNLQKLEAETPQKAVAPCPRTTFRNSSRRRLSPARSGNSQFPEVTV